MQIISADFAPMLLAASATASVAYSYRNSIARYSLWGYSYVKQALVPDPLEVPVLNVSPTSEKLDHTIIRLFPHIESIDFVYNDTTTIRPTEAQETALREAIREWRAWPIDDVCQHVSLYEILHAACAVHSKWATTTFPSCSRIKCDTLLIELTRAPLVVEMNDADGTVVCLVRDKMNALNWSTTKDS